MIINHDLYRNFVLDTSQLNDSVCPEGGIGLSDFFLRRQVSKGVAEYHFPRVFLIPPYDVGCFVKLYYNSNSLEDNIYISKDGTNLNHADKWRVERNKFINNLYQISLRHFSRNQDMIGK